MNAVTFIGNFLVISQLDSHTAHSSSRLNDTVGCSLPSWNQLFKPRRERSRHLIVKQAIGEMLVSINL